MYDEVEERITRELDVVKLIKGVNQSKLALKASLLDPKRKFQIAHSYKSVIDVDEETSTEEEPADSNAPDFGPKTVLNDNQPNAI